MDQIHHTNMKHIITHYLGHLSAPDTRKYKQEIGALLAEHTKLTGKPLQAFFSHGELHTNVERAEVRNAIKGTLDLSLIPSVNRIMKDRQLVKDDMARIGQMLMILLRPCKNWQDVRDALPNCMSSVFDTTMSLPRTRPEAFMLVDDPRKYEQYLAVREKMEFYSVTNLLY